MKIEIYKDKNGDSQVRYDKEFLQASRGEQEELCMDGVHMLNNELLGSDPNEEGDDES